VKNKNYEHLFFLIREKKLSGKTKTILDKKFKKITLKKKKNFKKK